tara:strand:- start:331 stop:492 length:162 start_codon:yes stop_codon:yes gene_type:complete
MGDINELDKNYSRKIILAAQDILASMLNDLGDDELTINSSQPCGDYKLTFKKV